MNVELHKLVGASSVALAITALSAALILNTAHAQVDTEINSQDRLPTPGQPSTGKSAVTGSAGTRFSDYDANGDGKLSQDEMKRDANLMQRARSLDVNKDGVLSTEEYSAPGATSVTPPK